MKRMASVCALVVAIVLIGSPAQAAEPKTGPSDLMGCPAAQQEQAGGPPPMMGCSQRCQERCQEMMRMPMAGPACPPIMHQMMGPMMSPLGMGMKGMMGGAHDPKIMGRMLQMRGDILKAVGEVLLRYGKEMAGEGK